ncbi:MAG: NAD-dependent epimerase/dehydratase family protein [Gammaproteobacteria bacterium]|nr:NAD-dependent epimerase/dehydratase family protein [Gammaproteobacteria bacterium]
MKILLTGATGFVGGALAAELLNNGDEVIALSRNDPDGNRTLSVVQVAARGSGFELTGDKLSSLTVVNFDINRISDSDELDVIKDIDVAWHIAADMRYSINNILEVFDTNVGVTSRLYKYIAQNCRKCLRFYYVSTAYTAHAESVCAQEKLHLHPKCVNAYQMSKWNAEHTLSNLQKFYTLPVTIFRPSVIIGNQATGWSVGKGFGYYMFADAIYAAKMSNMKDIIFDINRFSEPDLVPIDMVVNNANHLIQNNDKQGHFEIVHSVGGRHLTTEDILRLTGEMANVEVIYGPPRNTIERKIGKTLEFNKFFQGTSWTFDQTRMKKIIGENPKFVLSEEVLRRVAKYYFDYTLSGGFKSVTEKTA